MAIINNDAKMHRDRLDGSIKAVSINLKTSKTQLIPMAINSAIALRNSSSDPRDKSKYATIINRLQKVMQLLDKTSNMTNSVKSRASNKKNSKKV